MSSVTDAVPDAVAGAECAHVLLKGVRKGDCCGKKCNKGTRFCSAHIAKYHRKESIQVAESAQDTTVNQPVLVSVLDTTKLVENNIDEKGEKGEKSDNSVAHLSTGSLSHSAFDSALFLERLHTLKRYMDNLLMNNNRLHRQS
jgi:hypothetical protein